MRGGVNRSLSLGFEGEGRVNRLRSLALGFGGEGRVRGVAVKHFRVAICPILVPSPRCFERGEGKGEGRLGYSKAKPPGSDPLALKFF